MKDPLVSWSEGPPKRAIIDFVDRVCRDDSLDFVPEADRVAVFDNDGTLWCEYPVLPQAFFLIERVRQLCADHPDLAERGPFRAALDNDLPALLAHGKRGIFELFAATHGGMTVDEFGALASEWLARARHPELGTRFVDNVYAPQRELLDYLRENGFRTFIVSGGGIEFIRAFAEQAYGIRREQVIGSSDRLHFELVDGVAQIMKLPESACFNDREIKPATIALHIGRRPIFAFGNSDGDLAMMRYTLAGAGPRLAMLLHHDDAEREFVYDRDFPLSPLAEALDGADDYGLTRVSMQRDWVRVF